MGLTYTLLRVHHARSTGLLDFDGPRFVALLLTNAAVWVVLALIYGYVRFPLASTHGHALPYRLAARLGLIEDDRVADDDPDDR